MKVLKPNLEDFFNIPDFPYKPNYVTFRDMQMHYIDEGAGETILALHGEPSWSYLYRKFVPVLAGNYRFIAPDFIGFGKSDKIQGWKNYSFNLHYESLKHFIKQLNLNDITLVVQDWGGLLGLSLLGEHPEWFKRVVIMNTFLPKGKPLSLPFKLWQAFAYLHPSFPVGKLIQFATKTKLPREVINAYNAPFSGRKYKSGVKAFPQLIPGKPSDNGVDKLIQAREALKSWHKPALVLFSDKDPVMSGLENFFHQLIPGLQDKSPTIIKNAGHFLQEDKGEEIAEYIKRFIIRD